MYESASIKEWLSGIFLEIYHLTNLNIREVTVTMTTKQILELDFREEENQEIIQKVLRQIKPLSKYSDEEDIPFEAVEKAIVIMSKKYNMRIREFVPDVWTNKIETIWRVIIIDERNLSTAAIVYGISIYEVFAKCAIQMYAMVLKGITKRK